MVLSGSYWKAAQPPRWKGTTFPAGLILALILGLLSGSSALGQERAAIQGTVTDTAGQGISQVEVTLRNTQKGTATDKNGYFRLEDLKAGSYQLEARALGYHTRQAAVTLSRGEVADLALTLKPSVTRMEEMVVTGTREASYVKESPVKVEVVNASFLEQNPSNSIMGNIDQVNGIQQQTNCGVCGTNALRINGMEGPYTLMLIDNMPIMSNLASVYGLNGIPSSMVDQIEIVKGPNSTLYGSQAMGGVINVRTKDPADMPLVSANSYYTGHNEWNADLNVAPELSDAVQTTISANYFRNQARYDFNNDNFLDVVLNDRLSVFNKWQFDLGDVGSGSLAGRYYREDRLGGTMDFEHRMRGNDSIYGESIRTRRYEVFGNYDIPLADEDLRLDFSYTHHDQDSYYGTEYYKAEQSTGFANLIWTNDWDQHTLLTGLTGRWEQYTDNSPAQTGFSNLIPGLFVQDEWSATDELTVLSGLRLDRHEAHGNIISPRLNLKYAWSEWTTARLNLGSGFRQVHLFTEDHAALTGTREVVIQEDLQPERSYNATVNLNHVYQTKSTGTGELNLDGFYNYFTNKITPDYDTDPDKVIYRNLDGYGITRGVSLSLSHDFQTPLTVKLSGTYQSAFQVSPQGPEQERTEIPFTPAFSGNFRVKYQWAKPGINLAYTGQVTGPQPMPTFEAPYQRPAKSEWYSMQNIRVGKKLSHQLEVYGGVKNLLNWTQPTPLIDPENPFGEDFDTIYAYGPLQPRRVYVGVRWHWDE